MSKQEQRDDFRKLLVAWEVANGTDFMEKSETEDDFAKRLYVLFHLESSAPESATVKLIHLDESNAPYIREFESGARARYPETSATD